MFRSSKQLINTLSKFSKNRNCVQLARYNMEVMSVCSFYTIPKYNFAKISKKKQERENHEKEKEEAHVPKNIDLNVVEEKMKKEMENIKTELQKIKAGRITAYYFDGVKISAYGQKTNLSELVQFVPKTANVMVLNVFDEGVAADIVKTLENSDKNLTIKRDGKAITCTLMGGNTKEMKENMIKQVKHQIDKSKDKVRDQRSDGIEMIKKFEKFVGKDVLHQATKEVQELHDKYVAELDKLLKSKEKEIMSA